MLTMDTSGPLKPWFDFFSNLKIGDAVERRGALFPETAKPYVKTRNSLRRIWNKGLYLSLVKSTSVFRRFKKRRQRRYPLIHIDRKEPPLHYPERYRKRETLPSLPEEPMQILPQVVKRLPEPRKTQLERMTRLKSIGKEALIERSFRSVENLSEIEMHKRFYSSVFGKLFVTPGGCFSKRGAALFDRWFVKKIFARKNSYAEVIRDLFYLYRHKAATISVGKDSIYLTDDVSEELAVPIGIVPSKAIPYLYNIIKRYGSNFKEVDKGGLYLSNYESDSNGRFGFDHALRHGILFVAFIIERSDVPEYFKRSAFSDVVTGMTEYVDFDSRRRTKVRSFPDQISNTLIETYCLLVKRASMDSDSFLKKIWTTSSCRHVRRRGKKIKKCRLCEKVLEHVFLTEDDLYSD